MFVQEVCTSIDNLLMNFLEQHDCLTSAMRTLLASCDTTLCPAKFRLKILWPAELAPAFAVLPKLLKEINAYALKVRYLIQNH